MHWLGYNLLSFSSLLLSFFFLASKGPPCFLHFFFCQQLWLVISFIDRMMLSSLLLLVSASVCQKAELTSFLRGGYGFFRWLDRVGSCFVGLVLPPWQSYHKLVAPNNFGGCFGDEPLLRGRSKMTSPENWWFWYSPPLLTICHHFGWPPSPLPRWRHFWTTPKRAGFKIF